MASRLQDVLLVGIRADQPAFSDVAVGTLYAVSDEDFLIEQSDGTAWNQFGPTPTPPTAITALTGDVTATGPGSAAATIANAAVTYAKIQNVAASRLLGNSTGSPAAPAEIPLVNGVEFDSGNLRTTVANRTRQIGITVDGGGSAITTGVKGYKTIPWSGTITGVRMLADVSGSVVIDLWKDTYANFPPVVGDSITASAKPTISAAQKSEDTTLTGWTTAVTAGDIVAFNVDSATTITRVTLELTIVITG